MQTFLKGKRVGYWLSEKKIKKLNFQAFADLCRKRGIEVIQVVLELQAIEIMIALNNWPPDFQPSLCGHMVMIWVLGNQSVLTTVCSTP
ncbi:inositol-tetrakisphosphate 1-kinase-like [Pantherophis guttatus]|uniref:Inositol-tetrakisphosphate 1-kinase-like n=1 Tax=Pantherophis guttatus TaxID=94885 RepID=A0ABM3Z4M2_PANGU|nr:inositol-tetrakisphosphate 1-kinase-like [Pantherophis guttatus]